MEIRDRRVSHIQLVKNTHTHTRTNGMKITIENRF